MPANLPMTDKLIGAMSQCIENRHSIKKGRLSTSIISQWEAQASSSKQSFKSHRQARDATRHLFLDVALDYTKLPLSFETQWHLSSLMTPLYRDTEIQSVPVCPAWLPSWRIRHFRMWPAPWWQIIPCRQQHSEMQPCD